MLHVAMHRYYKREHYDCDTQFTTYIHLYSKRRHVLALVSIIYNFLLHLAKSMMFWRDAGTKIHVTSVWLR